MLRKQGLWGKLRRGELRLYCKTRERNPPTPDHRGRPRKWNQEIFLLDDTYSVGRPRHTVLEAHCFRLANGKVGSSGLIDPKEILYNGTLYVRPEHTNPRCELCDAGDVIPNEERFYGSKITRPNTRPLTIWGRTLSRLKIKYNHIYDVLDQRAVVKATIPPR
jgi:hypothetical protein